MAETMVENQVCNACGADVRKGALFCYNCGGEVASEIAVAKNDKIETVANTRFQENISTENGNEFKQSEVKTKQEVREIFVEKSITKPIEKSSSDEEAELKSAAAIMRGKSKIIQPKKVEVVWEEHDNTPNLWFILVAVFLTIVTAVILFLALRMK
ncbi:MAG TPA: zinc ribbon domain-containing protein [Pyrinomonadaceae bacterium]|nr:zinc ribbon domain-containing protein [Pyrinomonadaceae bacterium]